MGPKLQYRSKNRKIEDLIESIKSRIYDFEGEKISWGHVGTMEHIISQLNNIDNSLAAYDAEPSIETKTFNMKTRRFEIDNSNEV